MCVVTRSPCGNPGASHSLCVSARPVGETSHIETLQASATSWRTSSRPIPEPPPVTTAILHANSFMCAPSLGIGHALFERTACAEGSGQLLSGSDYALPRAEDCSPSDVTLADQPTTVNPSASRAR